MSNLIPQTELMTRDAVELQQLPLELWQIDKPLTPELADTLDDTERVLAVHTLPSSVKEAAQALDLLWSLTPEPEHDNDEARAFWLEIMTMYPSDAVRRAVKATALDWKSGTRPVPIGVFRKHLEEDVGVKRMNELRSRLKLARMKMESPMGF